MLQIYAAKLDKKREKNTLIALGKIKDITSLGLKTF